MAKIFNTQGSSSDILSYMKSDLLDTYNNQTGVLQGLVESEDNDYASAFTARFSLDNYQYDLIKAANSKQYSIKTCDTNHTEVALIDCDDDSNTYGQWADIEELEDNIDQCADSTYFMYQLANVADNDYAEGTSASSKISAVSGYWVQKKDGGYAKEAYANVMDTVAAAGDDPSAITAWLVAQYQSLASAQGDNATGKMSFNDNKYVVQGFSGSYAVGIIGEAVSTVVGTVATVISPIVGVAISAVSGLVQSLVGLIPDKTDTWIVEKSSNNNIYAQPIFQGEYAYNTYKQYLHSSIRDYLDNSYGMVSVRLPGWAIVFNKYDNAGTPMLQWESYLSIDHLTYSPYYYNYNHRNDTSNVYKSDRPYLDYMEHYYNGYTLNSFTPVNPALSCSFMQSFSTACMRPASLNRFYTEVSDNLADDDSSVTINDVMPYANKSVMSLTNIYLWQMFGTMCGEAYGYDYVIDLSSANFVTLFMNATKWKTATSLDIYKLMSFIMLKPDATVTGDWENTVNMWIPTINKIWKNHSRPLEAWKALMDAYSASFYQVTPNVLNVKKPHFIPPKYSTSARATTIAVLATAGAITIAAVVGKAVLKGVMRKKSAAEYAKIEKLHDQLKDNPDDKDIRKKYKKAIKKYNRWSGFCGRSRLSYVSGWETGSDTALMSTPSNLGSYVTTLREATDEHNYGAETLGMDMNEYIARLIAG